MRYERYVKWDTIRCHFNKNKSALLVNQQTQNSCRRLYQSDVVRANEIATNIKGTGDHQ